MKDDDEVTVRLTRLELRSLVTSAEVGLRSGKLIDVFKTSEEDNALMSALVKAKIAWNG